MKPAKTFWAKRLTGYLKTRDGQELRYSVLLPKGRGPFPTLLHYNGYDAGAIGGTAYLQGDTTYPRTIDRDFIAAGYAVIGVNTRSTGCSTGDTFDWLRPLYGQDGYDAVEFAASQPWSNGRVGMYSWSWAGMSQLWTASFRPPHLKAIAPGMVIADPRADSYAPGGVPQPTMITQWAAMYVPDRWRSIRQSAQSEGDTRCLEQLDRNLKTLDAGSPGRLVLQHPFKDDYQEERTVARRVNLIEVPVLSLTGFQDEATTSRGGYYQWNVEPDLMWMIDTNGGHSSYASETYRAVMAKFFEHFVKGRQNGFESTPRLQIWEESRIDAGKTRPDLDVPSEAQRPSWVISRSTISPEVVQKAFFLAKQGRLTEAGAGDGTPDAFEYPVVGPSVLQYGSGSWGPMNSEWQRGSLHFTTEPLQHDIVTYGPASADLWISSDRAPDADLQVTVTAVTANGEETYVQRGWLRLSNRALNTEKSTVGRPVLLDRPDAFAPLPPGQPVLARLEVNRFSYAFRAGTRLRVWIDTPSPTGLYPFSYNPVPTTLQVWHDAQHASQLVLNVLPNEGVPQSSPAVPCGEVESQPCRQDPVPATH